VNELGDIQTEPARYGGLTDFGKDVIREMNRLGLSSTSPISRTTVCGTGHGRHHKPVILSHTVLGTPFRDRSHGARALVPSGGGVIGIFPVNSSYHGFSAISPTSNG